MTSSKSGDGERGDIFEHDMAICLDPVRRGDTQALKFMRSEPDARDMARARTQAHTRLLPFLPRETGVERDEALRIRLDFDWDMAKPKEPTAEFPSVQAQEVNETTLSVTSNDEAVCLPIRSRFTRWLEAACEFFGRSRKN